NEEDKPYLVSENIKRLNLKYELSKIDRTDVYNKEMPILVSIKNFFISENLMAFSIDLDLLMPQEDLEIKFVNLIVFFYSGKRIEISINEIYEMSEIYVNDEYDILNYKKSPKSESTTPSITQERVIQEISKDFQTKKEKTTSIYEKNQINNPSEVLPYISTIHENSERLKNMESYLKDISETLKHMKFNGASLGSPGLSSQDSVGIQRIKRIPVKSPIASKKLTFLPELKEIFNNRDEDSGIFNFKDILKPMDADELKLIVLDDEVLEKREQDSITRQMERMENDEPAKINLEALKKPPI
ncbi:MAG: hypothetical protein GY870_16225, partial [archaeon]|nr:hypothetical protein [archaeon]